MSDKGKPKPKLLLTVTDHCDRRVQTARVPCKRTRFSFRDRAASVADPTTLQVDDDPEPLITIHSGWIKVAGPESNVGTDVVAAAAHGPTGGGSETVDQTIVFVQVVDSHWDFVLVPQLVAPNTKVVVRPWQVKGGGETRDLFAGGHIWAAKDQEGKWLRWSTAPKPEIPATMNWDDTSELHAYSLSAFDCRPAAPES